MVSLADNPVTGTAVALRDDFLASMERLMLAHPTVAAIDLGLLGRIAPQYAIFDPDGVQRVFTARDVYSKDTPVYREMVQTLGKGLLTTEGETWVRQKRTVQPLFTKQHVTASADLMAEQAVALADRWEAAGGVVDLHHATTGYALSVVGRALFGEDLADLEELLLRDLPYLNDQTVKRGLSPFALPRSVPTPRNRKMHRLQARIVAEVDRIIERRRREGSDQADLLGRLLTATDPETGAPISDDEVRDQVLVFLLAGHDTTATALTFGIWLLGHHPQAQERLHAELDTVLAGRTPSDAELPQLQFTEQAVKEAMRLYPSAYVTGRTAEEEDEVCGVRIPSGALVIVCQWATHRHPDHWDRPDAYDPDRFLPEAEKARHRYAYFPFGGGPRACIGGHFAMTEQVIALATLAQRFRFRSLDADVPLETGITLIPEAAVRCEVTPR